MNTFKAVVLLCAVLGASCSQHMYNQRGWDSAPATQATGGSYGQAQTQTQSWAPATEAPVNVYGSPAAVSEAPSATSSSDQEAHSAAIHQVCTCVTLPAPPQAPELRPTPAPAAPAKPETYGAQQTYNAPSPATQQTYTAPVAQEKPTYGAEPSAKPAYGTASAPATNQQGTYSRGPAVPANQRPATTAYPTAAKTY